MSCCVVVKMSSDESVENFQERAKPKRMVRFEPQTVHFRVAVGDKIIHLEYYALRETLKCLDPRLHIFNQIPADDSSSNENWHVEGLCEGKKFHIGNVTPKVITVSVEGVNKTQDNRYIWGLVNEKTKSIFFIPSNHYPHHGYTRLYFNGISDMMHIY